MMKISREGAQESLNSKSKVTGKMREMSAIQFRTTE